MSAAAPLAIADPPRLDHLSALRRGIRFFKEPVPALTPDGHKYTADVLRVKGPNDPALMASLKTAVEWRVGLLSAGLPAARARTWAEWLSSGKPVAVRSGITHSGPDKGKPWSVSGLPSGVCEACSSPMGAIVGTVDTLTLRADVGEGMCSICCIAWARVLEARK